MTVNSYRPRRRFLSPLDALEVQTMVQTIDNREDVISVPSITSTNRDGVTSSASASATSFLPCPPSIENCPFSVPSSPKELSAPKTFEEQIYASTQEKVRLRRYSEQDIKTRNARASLVPVVQKHRSAASYPIYSPSSLQSGYSSSPPFLPWGINRTMEPFRPYTCPNSSASSITTRSSFESRTKSPLSTSSFVDYTSSRTSQDSSYSNNDMNNDIKEMLLVTRPLILPTPSLPGKRMITEPIVPVFARYGPNGEDRQAMRKTMISPQRMSISIPKSASITFARRYKSTMPGEGFKKLPEEILLVILAELKELHLQDGSLSCTTCWMRDLTNLGLSCKKWWGAARCILYEDIRLVGSDSVLHTKKKFRMKYGTRLKLLRQTLRARPDLAEYVKSLKVPAVPDAAKSKNDENEYLELVASLVMACPNLERLLGFYTTYNHEFSRLVHALSSRQKLKERVWIINASPFQRQRQYKLTDDLENITPIFAPGPLLPEQCSDMLLYHSNWPNLQTLFLHCNPGGMLDSTLFTDIFYSLPSLESLHVSSFPAPSFTDQTLLSLPLLKRLRLDNLPGLTGAGLSSYASSARSRSLESLTLISIPAVSLPVLARLFCHLKSLTRFAISQTSSPSLPSDVEIFLHPYLASSTLVYLHWEFTNPDDDKATDILAKAITFGGFPSLKTLRATTDHEGSLQKLCRPRARIELASDRYRNIGPSGHIGLPFSQSAPSIPSPTCSSFSLGHKNSNSASSSYVKSPTQSTFSLNLDQSSRSDGSSSRESGMSLATARRMAQRRSDMAATQPKFHIVIWDENGRFVEKFAVGGFIGRVESSIYYSLKPDVDGMDEALVGMEGPGGLLDGGVETSSRDRCNGSWNLDAGAGEKGKGSGKGKNRWWHTERGRWRDLPLEKFF